MYKEAGPLWNAAKATGSFLGGPVMRYGFGGLAAYGGLSEIGDTIDGADGPVEVARGLGGAAFRLGTAGLLLSGKGWSPVASLTSKIIRGNKKFPKFIRQSAGETLGKGRKAIAPNMMHGALGLGAGFIGFAADEKIHGAITGNPDYLQRKNMPTQLKGYDPEYLRQLSEQSRLSVMNDLGQNAGLPSIPGIRSAV